MSSRCNRHGWQPGRSSEGKPGPRALQHGAHTPSVPRPASPWRKPGALPLVLAVVLGLLLPSGCATVGRQFPVESVARIRMNETDQNEIRALFGPPWRTGVEDGRVTWTYGRYKYRLFGETETTDLVLRFDDRGVVVSYTFSTTEHPG